MTPDGMKRLMLDEGTGPLTVAGRMLPYFDGNDKVVGAASDGIPTIAFGRNLQYGIRFSEAKLMLTNDLTDIETKVNTIAPFLSKSPCPAVWADVLDMIQYNTGNLAAWPHLLLAMRNGNANNAVAEIENSDVYKGKGRERYTRFIHAVLYRQWTFTPEEEVAYDKMVAMG